MDSVSAKDAVAAWVMLINGNERYYYAKAMDIFYSMGAVEQRSLIVFFAGEAKNKQWDDKAEDSTQYASVIRSILFYYSGSESIKDEPTKSEFKALLGKWIRLHEKEKRKFIKRKESKEFTKELEDL